MKLMSSTICPCRDTLGLDNSFSNVSSTEELHEGIKHLVKTLSDMFPVRELSLHVSDGSMWKMRWVNGLVRFWCKQYSKHIGRKGRKRNDGKDHKIKGKKKGNLFYPFCQLLKCSWPLRSPAEDHEAFDLQLARKYESWNIVSYIRRG